MYERLMYHTKELFREKSGLFLTLIFPIMMVAILGSMLAELDNPDTPIGTLRIVYAVDEGLRVGSAAPGEAGFESAMAVETFTGALAESDGVELTEAAGPEAAAAAVDAGLADAAMIFEAPLGISVAEGEDIYKNRAVNLIAKGFARTYGTYAAVAMAAPGYYMEIAAKEPPDFSTLTADKDLGVERSMMDFYAVTMVIMIAFMGGGIGGASDMFFARSSGMLRRITASPRSRVRLFLENVFSVVPQNIMQTLLVMIPSTLFLGAHYAVTWQQNLLLFAFFILLGVAVSAVFMLVGLFVRVNPYVPIMAVIWTLLFLSGTFSKEIFIEGFSEYTPMSIVQRAAFDLTVFGRPGQALACMGVFAIILIASCALGAILFKRKEIVL